jgi:hypothetical protein
MKMNFYKTEIEAATRHARSLPPETRLVFIRDLRPHVAFFVAQLIDVAIDDPVLDVLLNPGQRVMSESRSINAAFETIDAFTRADFAGVQDGLNNIQRSTL